MAKNKEKIEIPRNSPITRVNIGKRSLDLTWYNTTIFNYAEPYEDMSHVFIRYPHETIKSKVEYFNIFGNLALREVLDDRLYPTMRAQEPTEVDLGSYIEWRETQIDTDLDGLFDE